MTKRPKLSRAFVVDRAGAGFPHQSWWLESRTREDFDRRAEAELARIKLSKFSRVSASEGWAS